MNSNRRFVSKGFPGLTLPCMSSARIWIWNLEPGYHLQYVKHHVALTALLSLVQSSGQCLISDFCTAPLQSRFPHSWSHIIQAHCNPKQSYTRRSSQWKPLYAIQLRAACLSHALCNDSGRSRTKAWQRLERIRQIPFGSFIHQELTDAR